MSIVRLRHLAEVNPSSPAFDRLGDGDELTFLPMESVWPGSKLDISRRRPKSAVATGYTRFQDGDVLIPKITPTFEAGRAVLIHGLLGGVGAGTTELHVVRPGVGIDPRFLLYVVNTHSFLKLGEAEMYGVAGQQRVPDSFLRDLPVSLPSLEEQRRIAGFLDVETARIDKMAARRERQLSLLEARRNVAIGELFRAFHASPTRLKFLLRARPRYGVLVPKFEAGGVKFVRVNDLLDLPGRIPGLATIAPELSAQYPTTIIREGDLLVSVVGTLGRAAVAPRSLVGANVNRAIAVLRTRDDVDVELLASWINAAEFQEQALLATGNDSAQRTLGMEDMANFSLRWPAEPAVQGKLSREVRRCIQLHGELVSSLRRQGVVLDERRQALITAAVTGQFDVSTASGRNVTDGVPTP
ncbi:restriction endonuclease subunit S [Streptomyces sp. CMSTAAHL-2]|uniref:restriction endonuclease subunit S n=1 Tax=Streptomyces sp. CMSTAAHL-2 TaxID=2904522 RepID=UPI001E395126|nr:restriction endonuclease subunit S [Streptomyces sp. CMSTAAHL-2]MCE3034485.1 restriction endonuclease subunit S [Streptomyces sp. CMSTAAHL-2]